MPAVEGRARRLAARLGVEDVPLEDPRFRRVFAAEAISLLGTGIAPVALIFGVLEISDAAGVGLVLAARQVPLVALLLGGGVVADRRAPRAVLIAADAARALSQGLTAALLITGGVHLWQVVALQAVYGAAQAFSGPAQTGLIADVVAAPRLQAANSLRAFAESVGQILGPAVAGVLVVAVGAGWGLAADAASFALSALLLAGVRVERPQVLSAGGLLADLRGGWSAFRANDWLWGGVATMSLWNGLYGVYSVLGPVVADQELGGAATWAAIATAFGIGSVAGGLALVRFRPRRPGVLLAVGLAWAAGPALGMALELPVALVVALSVAAGAGLVGFNATWESTVQRQVPRAALSRVMSYDMFGSFALAPFGLAVGGLLAEPLGASTTLLAAGVLLLALSGVLWAIPGIRALRAPTAR
jgi:MFS family permease